MKALEHSRLVFQRYPDSPVLDLDRGLLLAPGKREGYFAAWRRVFHRVREEVVQDMPQQPLVHVRLDAVEAVVQGDDVLLALRYAELRHHPGAELAQVRRAEVQLEHARF